MIFLPYLTPKTRKGGTKSSLKDRSGKIRENKLP